MIATVIADGGHRQTATDQEKELTTGIALTYDGLTGCLLLEAELGLSGKLQQFHATESLKQGKRLQTIVESEIRVHTLLILAMTKRPAVPARRYR